jgi:hypothetical protein
MTDQPPDSDLYLRPAVKILGEKFVEEMRAHRFPIPRVRAGDDGHKLIFEWSKNLRLVITATAADFTIADDGEAAVPGQPGQECLNTASHRPDALTIPTRKLGPLHRSRSSGPAENRMDSHLLRDCE